MQFRRIHGRIVPIKDANERSKQRVKGAAEIVAGAAAAGGAGVGTAVMVKKAQKFALEAKNDYRVAQSNLRAAFGSPFLRVMKKGGKNDITAAIGKRLISKKMFRARNPILHAGAAVSALLIGAGVTKVAESFNKKNDKATHKAIGSVAGTAAAVATYGAYYRGLGFTKPLEIAVNVYSRAKGMARPFKKYGKGGPV